VLQCFSQTLFVYFLQLNTAVDIAAAATTVSVLNLQERKPEKKITMVSVMLCIYSRVIHSGVYGSCTVTVKIAASTFLVLWNPAFCISKIDHL